MMAMIICFMIFPIVKNLKSQSTGNLHTHGCLSKKSKIAGYTIGTIAP